MWISHRKRFLSLLDPTSLLLIVILFLVFFFPTRALFSLPTDVSPLLSQFKPHDPISIFGDAEFHHQAAKEGWDLGGLRDGSLLRPYVLEGYEISSSSTTLIDIRLTSVHFQIRNNLLRCTGYHNPFGIYFAVVTHARVENNIIHSCGDGIWLQSSDYNLISNNTVFNTEHDGIHLSQSSHNLVTQNIIYYNYVSGISAWKSLNNSLSNNILSGNALGINFYLANNSIFFNNRIFNSHEHGMFFEAVANNLISSNIIVDNTQYGIWLRSSSNCTVKWNDFIGNNHDGSSQAFDSNLRNTFTSNYWDEWISPDADSDDIVDLPYKIEGNQNNTDLTPLIAPLSSTLIHRLSKPTILALNTTGNLKDTVTIYWNSSIDNHNHSVTYNVYYSGDNGEVWKELASKLSNASFVWNTPVGSDSINDLIRVVAICSDGYARADEARIAIQAPGSMTSEATTSDLAYATPPIDTTVITSISLLSSGVPSGITILMILFGFSCALIFRRISIRSLE